jgi:hypothetical protein
MLASMLIYKSTSQNLKVDDIVPAMFELPGEMDGITEGFNLVAPENRFFKETFPPTFAKYLTTGEDVDRTPLSKA